VQQPTPQWPAWPAWPGLVPALVVGPPPLCKGTLIGRTAHRFGTVGRCKAPGVSRAMWRSTTTAAGQTPKSPNPAPPRPALAGKIAGIFPIPIGPGSGEHSGFSPDSRFGRDFGKSGNPEIVGVGKIAGICASINQDQDRPGRSQDPTFYY
jgi:hypothetical protein